MWTIENKINNIDAILKNNGFSESNNHSVSFEKKPGDLVEMEKKIVMIDDNRQILNG